MQKKRHSRAKIAAKLAQATDLASQGERQSDIARTLGISLMTLHRWRKSSAHVVPAATNRDNPNSNTSWAKAAPVFKNSNWKIHDCGD